MLTFENIFSAGEARANADPPRWYRFPFAEVDWRDDESIGLHWCAGGDDGRVGVLGACARCGGRFVGQAANDVCGPAADETGERPADLAEWQVGDVFGDGGGPREELEGEPSLGGAARGRGRRCEGAAGDVLEGGRVGGKVFAGRKARVVYGH